MAIDSEGSLVDAHGQIRHFSRTAFVRLASAYNRCFVCGNPEVGSEFTDEHVIPSWLLRRLNLHSRHITLPNAHGLMYGRYTLKCCERCNRLLGARVETPVSQLFGSDPASTAARILGSPTLTYQWLCLLFIKLHLKDREIRIDPDQRSQGRHIGELYNWDGLHHIHSVARSAQSEADIEETVLGTTLVVPAREDLEPFDFGSLSGFSTIYVRIGPVGLVSVLNDCGLVGPLVRDYLSRISGPLSAIQLREVAARLAYGNRLLLRRPAFWSELDAETRLSIKARPPPSVELDEVDKQELGRLIASACAPLLLNSQTPDPHEKIRQLERGEIQFLYHDDGSFIEE